MFKIHANTLAILCFAGAMAGQVHAKLNSDEIARLDKDLTPVGAERAGNKAGTIPEWKGGLTKPPAGFDIAKGHTSPFANEKPLFTITAQNWEQYKEHLSAGHIAMLKRYPNTYKMPVYPTHRTAALSDAAYDKIRKQADKVELTGGGTGIANWGTSPVPFPIPKNGAEAIWNHEVRNRAGGIDRRHLIGAVNPDGSFNAYGIDESWIFPENMDKPDENRFFYFLARLYAPSDVTGDVVLIHEPLDFSKDSRLAWVYNSGLRRVRRAPQIIYDSPGSFSEGTRTEDDYDMYNGPIDRFEWKLVGKKEMYIPYNAYALHSKSLKAKDVLKGNHIEQNLARYELHRVWVVEATLKPGARHIYGKRVFYIDEDSWTVAVKEQHDGRGQLWRVGEAQMMQFYDVPLPYYAFENMYDLQDGRYFVAGFSNEEKPWRFAAKARRNDFDPDALRRAGTK
ncbi:DUF1329 domain-containing protein [Noviherbaspirillum sp. ST9]|uniref:DUF1329 domain-containing protein n=1 Tax=Noviherbaspirillum sp. ST9 TaxID=3401606 RepID=UPI003B58AC32